MKSVSPSIMEFGAFRLISPDGSHRLPVAIQAALAVELLPDSEPALLPEWVAEIERLLGVTEAHRQALADRAVSLIDEREAKRRRLLDAHQHAAALNAPMRDPAKVIPMEEKLSKARELRGLAAALKQQSPKKDRQRIKALAAEAAKLEREAEEIRLAEMEEDRLYGDAKEPILRAKARGEEVEAKDVEFAEVAKDEFGARIIESSGRYAGVPALIYTKGTRAKRLSGIEHAFDAGYLDAPRANPAQAERLYETGQAYREAYEIAEGQTGNGGEGGSGFGPKAPQPRLIEAGEKLSAMRKYLSPIQRDLLDRVCGKDERLRDVASTRGSVPGLQRRLRLSLKVAAEGWNRQMEEWGNTGEDPKSAQVAQISRALRRLRIF